MTTGPGDAQSAWLRITGITIPQGSTINSAILRMWACAFKGTQTAWVAVRVDARQTPGNPANAKAVTSPASVISGTGGAGTKVTVTPTQTFSSAPTGKDNFGQTDFDVTALVRALVAANTYTNGEMVFYAFKPGPRLQPVNIYQKDWGNTKQARLILDFEESALAPDKTSYRYG
jgi:hypothetical protein